eukprot:3809325-Pyramimonas_sp.AAC.1
MGAVLLRSKSTPAPVVPVLCRASNTGLAGSGPGSATESGGVSPGVFSAAGADAPAAILLRIT